MRRRRKIVVVVVSGASVLAATLVAATCRVESVARDHIRDPEDAPRAPVAIVPGAGVRPDGSLSSVLEDRIVVAARLYKDRKAAKILVSGDHGTVHYDEPSAMAAALVREGVPAKAVFLDHAGFDTHATLYRARHVFLVREALVVSQEYHLPRAIYLARELGIEAMGVRADRRTYERGTYYSLRERGANVKAVLAIALELRPKFLGPTIPLEDR